MSERSYRRNVERKVAGCFLPVCTTASAERISPKHTLPPDIHAEYAEIAPRFNSKSGIERHHALGEYREFLDRFFGCLGGVACNDVTFFRPQSRQEFVGRARHAILRGDRVIVDLKLGRTLHTVGLQATDESNVYSMKANWIPYWGYGGITLGQLYPLLAPEETEFISVEEDTEDYPFYDSNVTIIPAV